MNAPPFTGVSQRLRAAQLRAGSASRRIVEALGRRVAIGRLSANEVECAVKGALLAVEWQGAEW